MNHYAVWYMRPEFFRDGGSLGAKWLKERSRLPDPAALDKTHIHLLDADADGLEPLFAAMQGEKWSPNGEGRLLIELRGLQHTSMSVGDIAVDKATGKVFIVDHIGFTELEAA